MIVVSAKAPVGNLGDLVIRRNLVSWLSGLDELVLVRGGMPHWFVEAMGVQKPYTLMETLTGALGKAVISGSPAYVYSPGAQMMYPRFDVVARGALNVALTAAVRAAGGKVLKVGRGYEGDGSLPWRIEALQSRLLTASYSRDVVAVDRVRHVRPMPDISLWSDISVDCAPLAERDSVVLSARKLTAGSASPIADIANELRASLDKDLGYRVVQQVEEDGDQCLALARALGDRAFRPLVLGAEELDYLHENYGRARVVVSDRLHVLLLGLTAGAVPLPVETGQNRKLYRQLTSLGLGDLVVDPRRIKDGVARWLAIYRDGGPDLCRSALENARRELEQVRREVRGVLGSPR